MSVATIHRATSNPKGFLAKIDREQVLDNRNLSNSAKGLLVHLLGRNANEGISLTNLHQYCADSPATIRSIISELKSEGFMISQRYRLPNGKYDWHLVISETVIENYKEKQEEANSIRVFADEETIRETAAANGIDPEKLKAALASLNVATPPQPTFTEPIQIIETDKAPQAAKNALPRVKPTKYNVQNISDVEFSENTEGYFVELKQSPTLYKRISSMNFLKKYTLDKSEIPQLIETFRGFLQVTRRANIHNTYGKFEEHFCNWLAKEAENLLSKRQEIKTQRSASQPSNPQSSDNNGNIYEKAKEAYSYKVNEKTTFEEYKQAAENQVNIISQVMRKGGDYPAEKYTERRDKLKGFLAKPEQEQREIFNRKMDLEFKTEHKNE